MSAKNNLNIKHNILIPVGVLTYNNSIALLEASVSDAGFYFAWSKTGEYFEPAEISKEKRVTFKNGLRIHLPSECRDFRFALVEKKYLVTYVRTYKSKKYRITAYSKNLYDWNVVSEVEFQGRESVIASETLVKGQYLMYESEVFVSALTSTDFKKWDDNNEYVFTSRAGMFDDGLLKVMGAFSTDRGIALIYESINDHDEMYNISVGGAIFSFDNPRKILWRSETALWKSEGRFPESTNHSIIGAVPQDDDILLYWVTAQGELLIGRVKPIGKVKHQLRPDRVTLTRHVANPVLSPDTGNKWENEAVFNPAAVQVGDNVHLLYRAVGNEGMSVLGHSESSDGLNFDKRSSSPVFEPSKGFGLPDPLLISGPKMYLPEVYRSGGSWVGCEDPRAVKIGKCIYVMYVAFGGWDSIRIALTSISEKDFQKGIKSGYWNWKKPYLISPKNQRNKNWVLFPEKINGKYAILNGIAPKILVSYVEDIDKPFVIRSQRPEGPQPGREDFWDNKLRGAGPPPIKTDIGWLLLYHAIDMYDDNRYKLGAMVLDLNDPTKILYRASHPILEPDMHYENEGKAGVVYASGALVKDGQLFVYYGGGDRVVCVATVVLKDFLDDIIKDKQIEFTSPVVKEFNKVLSN